jgi:hypothetical protein
MRGVTPDIDRDRPAFEGYHPRKTHGNEAPAIIGPSIPVIDACEFQQVRRSGKGLRSAAKEEARAGRTSSVTRLQF